MGRWHLDDAMKFLMSKYREEMATLPEDQRIGFDAYCRRSGILSPQQLASIAKREVVFSDLPHGGAEVTGEEEEYEEG